MSSEYDTLYSLLENLIVTHQPETSAEPMSLSIVLPEEPIVKKRKPGRPPGSKNIEKLQLYYQNIKDRARQMASETTEK